MSRRPTWMQRAEQRRRFALKTGHIYFILAHEAKAIKIGYSANPRARYENLCTGSPEPLIFYGSVPGNREDETDLHKKFKHLRLNGEWFRECDELYNHIEDLAEEYEEHPQQGHG